jgi:hypothetical protein
MYTEGKTSQAGGKQKHKKTMDEYSRSTHRTEKIYIPTSKEE